VYGYAAIVAAPPQLFGKLGGDTRERVGASRLGRGIINFDGRSLIHNSPSVRGARHIKIDFDPNFFQLQR
jgi:hypothetical protein